MTVVIQISQPFQIPFWSKVPPQLMTIFTCIASHTHAVCPLVLFWSPPPATSLTALLCAGALPHHSATLHWRGWTQPICEQPASSLSRTPLLFYNSAVRCFQACFSHSCWLSQPKLQEQTSLQGAFPRVLAGVVTPRMTGEGLLG